MQDGEKYLYSIINAIGDPIFVKDESHRWVLLNQAYCAFMGYRLEELLGKTDMDFFPRQEVEAFWRKDEEVLASAQENLSEEQFTDRQGVVHTIQTKKTRYVNERGEKFIVGTIRDITERKRMEDTEKKHKAELEAFNKLCINRELQMIELKKEIQQLKKALGR